MRLLNHRTTSIAREDGPGMEAARAVRRFTERRPELLPGYKPHLSYKSPLRGYAYNKSGKRGYRADQVTGGMNRNTLTQKAPSVQHSFPLEHSTNPIISGEMRNTALRCSRSSLNRQHPANALHAGHNARLRESPHGFGVMVPDSWHAQSHGRMEPCLRACTGQPLFPENPAPSGDARAPPANQAIQVPESLPAGQAAGANPDGVASPASPGVCSSLPLPGLHQRIPQSAPGVNSSTPVFPPQGESVPGAPFGAMAKPIPAGREKPGTRASVRFSGAIRQTIDVVPRPSAPPIQGIINGAANLAGLIADGMVLAAGQIQGGISGAYSGHEPQANSAEAPKGVPSVPPVAARPGFGSRARKTAQLLVARAGNPPPE